MGGGSSMTMLVMANLTIRKDTGRINTSPISAIQPVIRMIVNATTTVVIPGIY